VAIITDGNGRWAERRGLPVLAGHEAGADTVKARLRDAVTLGIEELTVYSFSTENWNRSDNEVAGIMDMFVRRIDGETPELHDEGVRMRFIGRRSSPVSPALIERMEWAESVTRDNTRITAAERRSSTRREPLAATARQSSAAICTRPRCTTPI
jgi:undecaprenyl diphosphate synthase